MSRTTSIVVIAVVAVVAFGGAFFVFSGDDEPATTTAASDSTAASESTAAAGSETADDNPCRPEDPQPVDGSAYEVTVASQPDPPTPRDTTFEIAVDRDGQPVSGATVCLDLDMTDMSHGSKGGQAQETEPGRYEVGADFDMRGTWEGTVFVTEPGETPVAAPVSFDVQ